MRQATIPALYIAATGTIAYTAKMINAGDFRGTAIVEILSFVKALFIRT